MILLRLFYEFFAIGLLAVGGGLATIPFLQNLSARTGWFTLDELADMIAVAESSPGPIGINIATYAGFNTAGVPGVLAAVAGIVTPSVAVTIIIVRFLSKFRENRDVDAGFGAMRPAACALIASVGAGMMRSSLFIAPFDWRLPVIFAVFLSVMLKTKLHPLVFIAVSAALGIVLEL